jgi:mercuric ion transport protein
MLKLEKLGTVGALLAAILCPVCFPKLALIGALLGLGALAPYEGWFAAAAQVFLVIAFVGHVVAHRRHRNAAIPLLAGVGVALVLGSLWLHYVEALVYAGLGAVVAATFWSVLALRRCSGCEVNTPISPSPASE